MIKNTNALQTEIPPMRLFLFREGGIRYWFFFAFLFRLILSFGSYHPDLGNHLDWGLKIWDLGPKNFYENQFWAVSWANQPPGTIYLFGLMGAVYRGVMSIFWWLNLKVGLFPSNLIPWAEIHLYPVLVKLPFILADLGLAYFTGKIAATLFNTKTGKYVTLVALFNPVFWYVSAVWGQTDSLINFLCILSIYLFITKRPLWGITVFLSSFYFKVSLLILLPVFLAYTFVKTANKLKFFSVLLVVSVLFVLFSTPFIRGSNPALWLYHLYLDRIIGHQGNMLTANCFNIWALFYGIDFTRTDLIKVLFLNLKQWGMLLFGFSYLGALIMLFKSKFSALSFISSLIIVAFSSFLLMTNMHERYLFPAVSLLTIVFLINTRLTFVYLLICIIWLLNLYHLWFYPRIDWLINLYSPVSIKILSLFIIVLFIYCVVIMVKLIKLDQSKK